MGKRIIISTSWDKLDFLSNREQKGLIFIEDNPFIGYNHEQNKFESKKTDSDIILIQDIASQDILQNDGFIFKKATDYFLHHTNENGLIDVQEDLFAKSIKGQHGTAEEHKYKPVFDIILNSEDNKLNKILNFLGFTEEKIKEENELEAKLNLLHLCLTPDGLLEAEELLVDDWNVKEKEFKSLKEVSYNGAFNENYVIALVALRDKLLA